MSTFGRRLTDDGIARVLDHWLDDGPVVAPDLMVESALRTAARTPQRRWRGRLHRFAGASPLVPVGLTLAAVAAVVALGAGLGQVLPLPGTEATPTPGYTGSPTPDASNPQSGWVVYTNEEDGYELTLPAGWTPAEFLTDPPGAMRFGDAHLQGHQVGSSFGALTVSIGATDGTVYDCAPSVCHPIVATTIDELDAAITNDSNQTAPPTITTTDVDVTLDGEPARLESVTFAGGLIEAGPQFHHVFAMHNGRPVVLSFDKYAYGLGRASNDIGWVETLIQGFRFVDPGESPESGRLITYTNTVDGYELLVDRDWSRANVLDGFGESPRGVTGFGEAFNHDYPLLTISIGEADGSINVCVSQFCPSVVATSIAELDEAIQTMPENPDSRVPGMSEFREHITLGGEAALMVGIRSPSGWTAAPAFHHVFAIHEGRPVVLAFDHWAVRNAEVPVSQSQIIESFRFLNSAPSAEASSTPSWPAWRVMTDDAHGYALEVPAGWEDRECCAPGARTFYANEATPVMIMVGDADGRITICQHGDCAEVTATQLSDLRHAVLPVAPIDAASWRHTLRHDALTLGGEPAEREWPDSIFGSGPEPIYDWVYTIHDGRPIVLRFNHFRGKFNPSEQQRIIESFNFLD